MAGTGFHSVVPRISTKKIILPRIAAKKIIVLRIAKKKIIVPQIAKVLFLSWQTAVHLRAFCQGVIPAVANRGIGAWFATKE
jgi:hypothetical protein